MKIALLNLPWYDSHQPRLWGVRAGSRWPHMQTRPTPDQLPRYLPFPFFLAITATALQTDGHSIMLCDGVAEGLSLEQLQTRLTSFAPEAIIVETSTPSLGYDLDVLARLRRRHPDACLIGCGMHPAELVPELLRRHRLPDYWIAGEYEQSMRQLIAALAAGKNAVETTVIPGLIRPHDRQAPLVLAQVADVNALPPPLFEQLPMCNYGDPVCGLPAPVAQSWLSRGCPFGCTFCVWPQLIYGNRTYRPRNLDAALDEVEQLIANYRCQSFYFDDDTANFGEARMLELAEKIRCRGLDAYPWSMMARADCMTTTMLDALAAAGMYSIKYGVESISPRLLDACDKGTRLERLQRAIDHTRKLGIKLHLTFTFGLPGENRDTIGQTLDYALKTAPETAQFSLCTPFPGTRFYAECQQNGWLVSDDWDRFLGSSAAVVSTPWLSASELEQAYAAALQQWRQFVERRLCRRRQQLVEALRAAARQGRRWTLLGDADFAAFVWEQGGEEVAQAYVEPSNAGAAALPVIISRHDEEKLYRQLRRQRPAAANEALRLYGAVVSG